MSRARALVLALIAAVVLALVAPTAQARPRPGTIPLPDGFQPEGIAIGKGPVAFFGSRADGDLYRADLRTGRGEVFSQGPGTPSLGLKADRGRLFVSGGTGGDARVVDARSGRVLRTYDFEGSFVNDVVLTRRSAWFTDSNEARLYQVSRTGRPAGFRVLPISGEWEQVPEEINANGITRTPDGRALLVVQSVTGSLFRVDPGTGVARRVDLGGYSLTAGDGMLLEGRRLYVVQNRLNQVAELRLSRDGRSGRLVDTIRSPRFDVPTTVARFGGSLYLPNARFTTPPTPTTTYDAVRVRD